MAAEDVAGRLAEYTQQLTFDDLDAETIDASKVRIFDSIASGMGAVHFPDETTDRVLSFCSQRGDAGTVPILGTDQRTPLEYAGLATATLIRYLDWNDYHADHNRHGVMSIGHASSNLGGLLPAAAASDASGEELLVATVIAYELHMRLAEETAQSDDGLDHVNYGLVATTLAAGRLRGLSTAELAQSVNIALAGHLSLWQTRCGELTEWKGIAFGNTVRNALVAVELAAEGIHGPAPIFEGEAGFSNLLSHPVELDPETFGGDGVPFKIHETSLKPYPVCGAIQKPLDCVFSMLDEEDLDWRDITDIEIEIEPEAIGLTAAEDEKWDPQNRNTADHSLPYCVARAFIDHKMGPHQFTDEKIADDVVRELMAVITASEHAGDTTVRVETDAETFVRAVEHPKGHRDRPFTDEDLRMKLQSALGPSSKAESVERIHEWVDVLETQPSIEPLFEILSPTNDA